MLVFNLGFASHKVISGGDVLFMDLARYLPQVLQQAGQPNLQITMAVPEKGMAHWQRIGRLENVCFKVLPANFFDKFENPVAVFLTYLVRSFQSLKFRGYFDYYYSCSDVWPDIFPPFVMRFLHPKTIWISRVYHIYLTPLKRKGSFFVNTVSVFLQRVSWVLMRAQSQKILALNKKLACDLEKFGFSKLPVLGAVVNLKTIKSAKPVGEKYSGVFVGRLSRTKGVYDLLDIWEQVVKKLPQAQLAVIGGGPISLQKELKSMAIQKGIVKNVSFLGFVSDEKKYAALKSSKVFLLPSHEEGWGVVVAEAMACGLPVVGYNLDIFGAVYKKGFLTAPLFDTQTFAKETLRLLTHPDERRALAKKSLAESSRFDNFLIASQFAKIL